MLLGLINEFNSHSTKYFRSKWTRSLVMPVSVYPLIFLFINKKIYLVSDINVKFWPDVIWMIESLDVGNSHKKVVVA